MTPKGQWGEMGQLGSQRAIVGGTLGWDTGTSWVGGSSCCCWTTSGASEPPHVPPLHPLCPFPGSDPPPPPLLHSTPFHPTPPLPPTSVGFGLFGVGFFFLLPFSLRKPKARRCVSRSGSAAGPHGRLADPTALRRATAANTKPYKKPTKNPTKRNPKNALQKGPSIMWGSLGFFFFW